MPLGILWCGDSTSKVGQFEENVGLLYCRVAEVRLYNRVKNICTQEYTSWPTELYTYVPTASAYLWLYKYCALVCGLIIY